MADMYLGLTDARNPNDFLKKSLDIFYQKQGRINLSDFSRRCGFASRSYLHEVLSGKKSLSADSAERIKSALKLPKLYFQLLKIHIHAEKTKSDQTSEIEKIRIKILKQQVADERKINISQLVTKPVAFQVYAALGTETEGASLSEIYNRTGLSIGIITEALTYLQSGNAIIMNHQRYFAVASNLDFLGLIDRQGLVDLCRQVSRDIQKNAQQILDRESNLVFYSASSIPRSRLPHLKAKLKAAISEIVDEEQTDDGDAVVQVFLGSWNLL